MKRPSSSPFMAGELDDVHDEGGADSEEVGGELFVLFAMASRIAATMLVDLCNSYTALVVVGHLFDAETLAGVSAESLTRSAARCSTIRRTREGVRADGSARRWRWVT